MTQGLTGQPNPQVRVFGGTEEVISGSGLRASNGAMERWKNKEHNEDRGKAEGELNILLKFKIDFKHT